MFDKPRLISKRKIVKRCLLGLIAVYLIFTMILGIPFVYTFNNEKFIFSGWVEAPGTLPLFLSPNGKLDEAERFFSIITPVYSEVDLTEDGSTESDGLHHILAWKQTLLGQNFTRSLGYDITIHNGTVGFGEFYAHSVTLIPGYYPEGNSGRPKHIFTDRLLIHQKSFSENESDSWKTSVNAYITGPTKPQVLLESGEIVDYDQADIPFRGKYVRSYSSPFFPVLDFGEAYWGILILFLLPVCFSLIAVLIPLETPKFSHKKMVRRGLLIKGLVVLLTLVFLPMPAIFYGYAPPTYNTDSIFDIIRWLTPIISIPALSVWVASFKNKKFAPVVAAAIMVLCLYQPLANLICLFATVIAWGYFAHGVCNLFGRFRKSRADAV